MELLVVMDLLHQNLLVEAAVVLVALLDMVVVVDLPKEDHLIHYLLFGLCL